ncbi:MAG: folate family ECF transporter S component [Lachnospiraceae bacterium]|nr:folate family ECF transporter S component [Lachnospiraceae bacterium]
MLKKIKNSALEFKSVRSLVIIAMLLAVHTVLSIVGSVRVSDSLKISTGFVATAIMAVSYGPVVGLIFGAAGDLIQWMINPTGPLALGLTLNAALAAMIYGLHYIRSFQRKTKVKRAEKKALRRLSLFGHTAFFRRSLC